MLGGWGGFYLKKIIKRMKGIVTRMAYILKKDMISSGVLF
jgi:hypothetical protein